MVRVGDRIPEVSLRAQNGDVVRLGDLVGTKNLVVYFYLKDETPGCIREACAFRDSYQALQEAGAEVVGISSDNVDSHREFAERRRIPFLLLSDPDRSARKAFGVPKSLGIIPGRVTYVIDRAGFVRHIFSSQLTAEKHAIEALEAIRMPQSEEGD